MKPNISRINVPKLIAANAHLENPHFSPKEQRAILAWMGRTEQAVKRRRGGSRGASQPA